MDTLIEHFAPLEDPRCPGKIEHRLLDILILAICAVMAGAESWEDVALYGRCKLALFQRFLPLPHGIPSHDTFRRVFTLIDPAAFESCFLAWVRSFAPISEHAIVAIDGKTLRRSFDRGREQSPLHLVSAWASEQSLLLAQRSVAGKSNEITAIPELLDSLALEDAVVTLDAMGCQKAIAARILERKADYLLVLKANQRKAYQAVHDYCEEHCFRVGGGTWPRFDGFEDGHGRVTRRRVFVLPEAAALPALADWPGLKVVLAVENIRGEGRKVVAQIRYFLSSYAGDPQHLARAIRRHWTIENGLHWVLDVTFGEDRSRVRDAPAARNLSLLRKIAINLANRDRGTNGSVRAKRKRAGWNDGYLLDLLSANFLR